MMTVINSPFLTHSTNITKRPSCLGPGTECPIINTSFRALKVPKAEFEATVGGTSLVVPWRLQVWGKLRELTSSQRSRNWPSDKPGHNEAGSGKHRSKVLKGVKEPAV